MSTYLNRVLDTPTPQSEPLDQRMTPNSAGGYVYPVDDKVRMRRFLIMGSERGSYYATERKLTVENAQAVRRRAEADGPAAVEEILEVSVNRLAPRNSQALFALAVICSHGDQETKAAAFAALGKVARTGSDLQEFVSYITTMRGWGRRLRKTIGNWYSEKDLKDAAFQAVKYRSRSGWSHRDLLRKAHPEAPQGSGLWSLFEWITQGVPPPERPEFELVHAFLAAQQETDPARLAELITTHRMPWETVPANMMSCPEVWRALGPLMPPVALVRNLPALTSHKVLEPMEHAWATRKIREFRAEEDEDGNPHGRPAPVHPMNILTALMTYRMGRNVDGKNTWTPVPQVADALDYAFDQSFSAAPQTGQRIYLGTDVSGSMSRQVINGIIGLTPRMAAAAMAMAIARREPNHFIAAFTSQHRNERSRRSMIHLRDAPKMEPLDITAQDSLTDAMRKTQDLPFGGTDCAMPMRHALAEGIPADCFIVLTDNQT